MGGPVTPARGSWRSRLTAQTWTAAAACLSFLAIFSAVVLLPVPYVMYSPGNTYDILAPDENGQPTVGVTGVETYPLSGELHMTTVAVTRASSHLTLPEVIFGHAAPGREVLPRQTVYPEGVSAEQVATEDRQMMDTSQESAVVAALRAADQPITERVVVASIVTGAPADGLVEPGDFVLAVDGEPVTEPSQVPPKVQAHQVGEEVELTLHRPGAESPEQVVRVPVQAGPDGGVRIGADVDLGYDYAAEVHFGVREGIGGPSAGLIFALGIYDQITPGDLTDGRQIAGTGSIDADGAVGPIGGIRQKVHGAESAGMDTFLVPAENCADLQGVRTDVELVRVDSLESAIAALEPGAELPRC